MSSAPKTMPLIEAILAEMETTKKLANGDSNLAHAFMWKSAMREAEKIIRKHFAALSVEDVAAAIGTHLCMSPDHAMASAQAVMQLLRKE